MAPDDPALKPPLVPGHDPTVLAYAREPDMARDYDRFHEYNRLFETDTRFLAEVLPEGGRVLDLGCGTGRHLAYLARRGHEVAGVDLSPHMLREAAKKLDRHGVEARLVGTDRCPDATLRSSSLRSTSGAARLVGGDICRLGEMDEFADAEFDAVICMFSTLGMVRGRRRRWSALAGWRRVLRPGGTLVVHAHNLWHNLTDSWGRRSLAWNAAASLVSKLWLSGRELGDKWMRRYRGMPRLYLHFFTLRELRALVRGAGFRIERELLLNEPRTGPFHGRLAYFRANGFLIAARKA